MINTNLPPVLHRFRDIAVNRSKIAIHGYPSCLTPPAEGFPLDDLPEIFSGCQRLVKVPNAVEILPKMWTAWLGRTNVTDDRQTDGRATANREREFTFTNKMRVFCNVNRKLDTFQQEVFQFKVSFHNTLHLEKQINIFKNLLQLQRLFLPHCNTATLNSNKHVTLPLKPTLVFFQASIYPAYFSNTQDFQISDWLSRV